MKKLLLLFYLAIYSVSIWSQGLVAYYPFNGNANDESGNNNNGTMMGGVTTTTDRFGNLDKAMQFNGTDSYIEVLNSASLNPDSQLTLSAWVLISDTNKIDQNILSKGWDLTDGYYGLGYSRSVHLYGYPGFQGHLNIERFTNNNIIIMGAYPKQDQWYYLALVYDGNNLISYLNGEEIERRIVSGILPPTDRALHIGKHNYPGIGHEYYFSGKIDDIRIYNRALSPEEISILTYVETDILTKTVSDFTLFQNYPNPFNPTTSIQYSLIERSFVSLKIFDILGNEITILVNEEKSSGTYEISFNAKSLSSGIYFYCLRAGNIIQTKKMILLK